MAMAVGRGDVYTLLVVAIVLEFKHHILCNLEAF
ncbi:MAG: hypothetical protein JWQ14_2037 [Adhaeribacter sp.]|nr:hypothetical protein [Adhaeribacter sp.]